MPSTALPDILKVKISGVQIYKLPDRIVFIDGGLQSEQLEICIYLKSIIKKVREKESEKARETELA